jgi:hypothetical protein
MRFVVYFSLLFSVLWISSQIGFLIDKVLFYRFKKQKINHPVFIIGNFRSGSTLLYRLLAQDEMNFTAMKSWEIYTAPSITQRKLLRGLQTIDDILGGRLTKRFSDWNASQFGDIRIHAVSTFEPEEDEGLFLQLWYGLFVWFFFPSEFEQGWFDNFDRVIPEPVKRRVMEFYRGCIKRHVFAHGCNRTYLAKNPSHTGKLDSLLAEFPDAKIIYLYREPGQMIASTMSWFSFALHYFCDLSEKYPFKHKTMQMARNFYTYPLERLQQEPEDR